jgi:SAM-dependent methyltransferase
MTNDQAIKEEVRKRYGRAALRSKEKVAESNACCGSDDSNSISSNLYTTDEIRDLPQEAIVASLGCGNPVAIAELREGEVVLDLGSGGGIDVLLSARRVGPTGKAYGLDMTDEMLELARENALKAGVTNVEFLKGEMEAMPLPDASVNVIISNCVVNLSPDKDAVLREAFRVLKPGGRFAVADIVTRGQLPMEVQRSLELWAGCIAGALDEGDYRAKLTTAGFGDVEIETVREYTAADAKSGGLGELARKFSGSGAEGLGIISAIIRARKPVLSGVEGPSHESEVPAGTARRMAEPIQVVSATKGAACCEPECCN